MSKIKLILLSSIFVLLAGCASQDIPDPDPSADTMGGQDSATTDSASGSGLGEGEFIDDDLAGGELADVVYFDFDSYELRPDDADISARHGIQLADNPGWSVRLEGHADERGSREYNIGLGERRAQAVRRVLLLQGAQPSQISTVSFGEERPVAFGSDEESWAQNRRVEFKYTN
ncbi:MAG: peptidoglycan-associated lipoprotein Pal [Woeseiaceae bacterium]|nr:peptidoglycan-associated lipoprotein Pal [Woeseiaceae bacterium]NIP19882.1 peptidoglycan-associated lipoprotein Pal [Woeseiaceae bacterium]NIS88683.1 peptidoglycan-associated lipoprotein Pal [Woeseiaceae bacterium]